eukprot:CAMPEP_0206238284 /NCGR_PEP_ID=MMETSP0047_2-20121206/14737_1 /ASSEMBLY_ACC=CAM_ASM_000192 /TAXON_ID=195065 /ORGANISM="Chroomonas mesostigmatica_cf, Strain CCMP1168" /LENGTH=228 /DNA_ID=CAMNT_0053662817 /DNA_START=29 /DNA_END=715 /DNA_ORIENTATION=+
MRARAVAAARRLLSLQTSGVVLPKHTLGQGAHAQRRQGRLPWALPAPAHVADPWGGPCGVLRRGLSEGLRGVAKQGDTVRLHFQMVRDDQVTILNTRRPGQEQPLEFTIGGELLPAFIEQMAVDMQVGQSKEVSLQASECFGEINEELIIQFRNSELPKEAQDQIKPGSEIEAMVNPESEDAGDAPPERKARGTVISHTDETTTVNFNHPLAGHGHKFFLQMISCKPK